MSEIASNGTRISTPPAIKTAEVIALDPRAVRARRRPLAILAVYAYELAFALLIATPLHAWANRTWGGHPDGDAVFYRPGGHELLSWLGDGDTELPIVVRITIVLSFLAFVAGQVAHGALVASLTTTRGPTGSAPRAVTSLRAGLSSFFPLMALGIVFGAIQLLWLALGFFASSAADHGLVQKYGDARSFQVRLLVLGFFVLLTLVTGVIADLGRVGIARSVALSEEPTRLAVRLREGIADALRTTRHAGGRAVVAWAWRALIAFALIAFGAFLNVRVGGAGGWVLFVLFVMHQLIVFTRTALRASWLANAVRLVETSRE